MVIKFQHTLESSFTSFCYSVPAHCTRTLLRRCFGKLPERRVDVEDGHLEVGMPPLQRLDCGVELAVESLGVAVEARHARVAALAVQPDGRREAPQRRHGRDADPPCPQLVQLLRVDSYNTKCENPMASREPKNEEQRSVALTLAKLEKMPTRWSQYWSTL